MDFDLFDFLDKHVTRLRFRPNVSNTHLYPSEASVQYYDECGDLTTVGGCLRASYFRVVGGFEKLSNDAKSEWTFKLGKAVEEVLVKQVIESGIWVDNNVKFYNEEYNISGEIDLLIAEPPTGVIVPCEIKSAHGYFAKRDIFGNTRVKGHPKFNQLCQLLVYLYEFRDQFPYGRMVYFFRDDMARKSFKISLHQEGEIIYPVIDGEVFKLFTINDILARYKQVQDYINRGVVPPADYELQYPDAKIHDFASKEKGKISKSKYEKWQKGQIKYLGNWECSYCKWKGVCYPGVADSSDDGEE
jgi:hypothetical protein